MAKSMMHIASEKPGLGAVQKCVGSFDILFSSPKGARVLRRTQTAKLESRLCVFLRETKHPFTGLRRLVVSTIS